MERFPSKPEASVESSCLEESKFIIDLLGKEKSKLLTPAYYQGKQKNQKVPTIMWVN